MGYILNRFDRLMELRTDHAINEQFKLIAIIVHDPNNKELKDFIQSHFLSFAKFTGKNFLFITFVQPPEEYADAIRRGEYEYAKLLVSDSKQLSGTDIIIDPLIRKYYNISDNGSYMVIAKKLSDNEVYKVSITKQSLSNQLLYLTEYCDCPTNFDELITQLKGESINIKEMLGDSLLKIVSLISPSSSPEKYGLHSYSQCEMAKQTINDEKQKLLDALKQSSDNEDLTEEVLNIYKIIEYAYMNVFNQGRDFSRGALTCNNYKLLDGKSKKFWNTFSRLSVFLNCESQPDELDYSAFILYLGKIVETELNLSICQMLRQSMGIPMPRYFNRYCHEKDRVYIPTKMLDVPLNKPIFQTAGPKALEGVALGNLLHAYKTAIGKEPSSNSNWHVQNPGSLEKMPSDFLSLWEDLFKVRNNAAHSRSVDRDMFRKTETLFGVFQESFIIRLYMIKKKLRPGEKNI